MGNILVTKKLDHQAARVWPFIADFANIYRIHPILKASYLNAGSHEKGTGAERTCEMPGGMSLVERVINWQEGQQYTVEITKTNMPIEKAHATIGVRSIRTGKSEVFFQMDYIVRFGWLGKIMDALMMLRVMVGMLLNSLGTEVRRSAVLETGRIGTH
ncbi:MAG: SRPBCC family protein [Cyanobacteria bacterium P01_A01_bin.3]